MVVLQQSNALGQVVVGAATSVMGAGGGTTTPISCIVKLFLTTDPIMGPLAAMGTKEMAVTAGNALVLYADPLGIKPSSVPRATSPKHRFFFPPGKCVLNPMGCVSWSSLSDVA